MFNIRMHQEWTLPNYCMHYQCGCVHDITILLVNCGIKHVLNYKRFSVHCWHAPRSDPSITLVCLKHEHAHSLELHTTVAGSAHKHHHTNPGLSILYCNTIVPVKIGVEELLYVKQNADKPTPRSVSRL